MIDDLERRRALSNSGTSMDGTALTRGGLQGVKGGKPSFAASVTNGSDAQEAAG